MRTQNRTSSAPGRITPLRLAAFSVVAAVVIVLVLYHVSDRLFTLGRFEICLIVAWSCIVAAGAATVALAVWLAVTHRRGWLIPDDLVGGLCERLEEGDYEEAQAIAVTRPRGVAPVVFEALDRLRRGRGGIVESAVTQCDYERRVLEGRVAWLGVLARLTYFFGALAGVVVFMEYLARVCLPGGGYYDPHSLLMSFAKPLVASLCVALPALAAQPFFARRAGLLAAEIGAVAGENLDYVLCDPRAAAFSTACERARAEPVFRRVRFDGHRGEADSPRLALESPVLQRRAISLGRLALCACAASVIVLEILATLSLVSAQDFMQGALVASFWIVGGLGVIGVGLVVATLILMRRAAPDARSGLATDSADLRKIGGARSCAEPLVIERTAEWLRVIGRMALLAGVLAVVLGLMREVEAMRTVWFWFDVEGLLAGCFVPLAAALSVYIFADVAGRMLRSKARALLARATPTRAR